MPESVVTDMVSAVMIIYLSFWLNLSYILMCGWFAHRIKSSNIGAVQMLNVCYVIEFYMFWAHGENFIDKDFYGSLSFSKLFVII